MPVQITRVRLPNGTHLPHLARVERHPAVVIASAWDTATGGFYFDRTNLSPIMPVQELSIELQKKLIACGLTFDDGKSYVMVGELKPGGRYWGSAIMVVADGGAEAEIAHGKQVTSVVRALLTYMRAYRDER